MDWSGWMRMTAAEQDDAQRRYRLQLVKEREANANRWAKMSPGEKARYPEARPTAARAADAAGSRP